MAETGTVARKRIDAQLRAAVIRGVRLLDAKDSGWWNGGDGEDILSRGHIRLERLDMAATSACVLGQRYPDTGWDAACHRVGIDAKFAHRYGFNTKRNWGSAGSDPSGMSVLAELWASVIQSRRYPRRKIASDPWVKKANRTWVRA